MFLFVSFSVFILRNNKFNFLLCKDPPFFLFFLLEAMGGNIESGLTGEVFRALFSLYGELFYGNGEPFYQGSLSFAF